MLHKNNTFDHIKIIPKKRCIFPRSSSQRPFEKEICPLWEQRSWFNATTHEIWDAYFVLSLDIPNHYFDTITKHETCIIWWIRKLREPSNIFGLFLRRKMLLLEKLFECIHMHIFTYFEFQTSPTKLGQLMIHRWRSNPQSTWNSQCIQSHFFWIQLNSDLSHGVVGHRFWSGCRRSGRSCCV